ncbi:leucyl aminopeptidase family protein [Psychrobium sp. nBUS_13]|uniref:leucyl aminopeptidase family protein n=1 Tax=Psychrobium sp. nBUS_13 TaxID=3395319 RepID=UPI003EB7A3B2
MLVTSSEQPTIALHIVQENQFDQWLSQQETPTALWLKNTYFKGPGVSLVPDADGLLTLALFVASDLSDFFACGQLATALPPLNFELIAQAQYQEAIAFGWLAGCYDFNRYKKHKKAQPSLLISNEALVKQVTLDNRAQSLVRDMVNTPAADMMPQEIAQIAQSLTAEYGGEVTQIIGDDLLDKNYPTIHAVGRASDNTPQLIDLRWGDKNAPKVTLVGKGVCFDSGGLDLKPAAGMRNMKKDMGGAAHVLGLAQLIMGNDLPVQLRVLIPAVENAVSANALRPGDVITTRAGITVEIDNTDAEGRLVLCDAISEAITEQPEMLIDFATLTGAMRVGLGTELPGFFASNQQTANALLAHGLTNSDPVWQMPLHKPYKSLLKSNVADISNCATGPFGGGITAALYLQEFTQDHTDWLHFDIMAWNVRPLAGRPIGGEAFGVRTVYKHLAAKYV